MQPLHVLGRLYPEPPDAVVRVSHGPWPTRPQEPSREMGRAQAPVHTCRQDALGQPGRADEGSPCPQYPTWEGRLCLGHVEQGQGRTV